MRILTLIVAAQPRRPTGGRQHLASGPLWLQGRGYRCRWGYQRRGLWSHCSLRAFIFDAAAVRLWFMHHPRELGAVLDCV